jgi:hypothetical protein
VRVPCPFACTMSTDPLADLMDSSWDLASPRRASLSGKLGAVGGFQVGLHVAHQARVGLLSLDYADMEAGCIVLWGSHRTRGKEDVYQVRL